MTLGEHHCSSLEVPALTVKSMFSSGVHLSIGHAANISRHSGSGFFRQAFKLDDNRFRGV
jgi:hypothetical protein